MIDNSPSKSAITSVRPAIFNLSEYNIWFLIKKKLAEFGEIEDLIVCENIGDHLVGNVYIKYTKEEYAEKCM